MKIELKEISVSALTNSYQDNEENGVIGFGGKLNIRAFSDKQKRHITAPTQKAGFRVPKTVLW